MGIFVKFKLFIAWKIHYRSEVINMLLILLVLNSPLSSFLNPSPLKYHNRIVNWKWPVTTASGNFLQSNFLSLLKLAHYFFSLNRLSRKDLKDLHDLLSTYKKSLKTSHIENHQKKKKKKSLRKGSQRRDWNWWKIRLDQ